MYIDSLYVDSLNMLVFKGQNNKRVVQNWLPGISGFTRDAGQGKTYESDFIDAK